MTPPRSSGSAPRSYRHQEASLSLQVLPRSVPLGPHSPAQSFHHRSPSSSRFPKFEDSSVEEKSRSDGVGRSSPIKAETSTFRAVVPEPLSLHHHQSRPSSAGSLRHLTSHQSSSSRQGHPLSPIPDSPSSHFALPLPSLHSGYLHPPRKIRLWSIVKPWLPVLAYVSTSVGFLIAIAFWKTQVFQGAFYNPVIPPYALSPSLSILSRSMWSVTRLRSSISVRRFGRPV